MQATQTIEQWFEQADESLPVLTMAARWAVVGLGLLLWLAGGRLLKAACVLGGLMLGMIAGGLSLGFIESAAVGVGLMVGLGLLGALGAWLVFRAWMAFSAALICAVVAPAVMLAWQGVPTEPLAEDAREASEQVQQRYKLSISELNDQTRLEIQSLIDQGDMQSLGQADTILQQQAGKRYDQAREIVFRNIKDIEAWWQSNDAEGLRAIGMAMLIGGGIGFLFGTLFPTHAAAVQSAIVGAVMIVIPGRELLVSNIEAAGQWTPINTRGTLITIGLITIVGVLLQWTLYLRRDDKKA